VSIDEVRESGAMKTFLANLLLVVSSYASIFGLYFSIISWSSQKPFWHWLLLAVSLVTAAVHVFQEVADYFKNKPKRYRTPAKINSYMRNWLSAGGRALIFSRDLSWAGGESEKELLRNKAASNELTI
jgi:hypothetical protein